MCKVGSRTISVHGFEHKSNNVCESFHSKLNSILPAHPSFFNFLDRLIEDLFNPVRLQIVQATQGAEVRRKKACWKRALAEKAASLEQDYSLGLLSATDLLRQAAAHWNDDVVAARLNDEMEAEQARLDAASASGGRTEETPQDDADDQGGAGSDSELSVMEDNWESVDWEQHDRGKSYWYSGNVNYFLM